MASLPYIELSELEIEMMRKSVEEVEASCYTTLIGINRVPYITRTETCTSNWDLTYSWKPRKVKVVKSVYEVWVVRKVDDEILAGGVSVVATSAKNAEFKVLQNLGVMDAEGVNLYSKRILDLE